jgi:MFS family permease
METTSIEMRVLRNDEGESKTDGERQLARPSSPETGEIFSDDNQPQSESAELPPIDGGSAAWFFLAAAFATELLCFGGAFSFSIFQEYLVQSPTSPLHKATNVEISTIGTLLVSFTYFAPALARGLWAHYAHWNRIMGFACVQLAGTSLIIASFGKSVPYLIVFMGLIPGILFGLTTLNFIIWLPQWFFKRRGLALGVAYAGAGTGGIIFPFIFSTALRDVGFAWTLRIWAGIIMLGGGVTAYNIRPRIAVRRPTSPVSFWALFKGRQDSQTDTEERSKDKWKRWLNAFAFTQSPLWMTSVSHTRSRVKKLRFEYTLFLTLTVLCYIHRQHVFLLYQLLFSSLLLQLGTATRHLDWNRRRL